jgi:hypothetical protein
MKPRAGERRSFARLRRANAELPDARSPVWLARLRLANQTFDLTFCPGNQPLARPLPGQKVGQLRIRSNYQRSNYQIDFAK